jgi:hypothetical protein
MTLGNMRQQGVRSLAVSCWCCHHDGLLGMIVVRWGMTEFPIDQQIRNLIGDDTDAEQQYEKLRNARQRIDFWQALIASNLQEPRQSEVRKLVQRIQYLNSKRDSVIHRLWGGGMQAGSWNAENHETTDAALLRMVALILRGASGSTRTTTFLTADAG